MDKELVTIKCNKCDAVVSNIQTQCKIILDAWQCKKCGSKDLRIIDLTDKGQWK